MRLTSVASFLVVAGVARGERGPSRRRDRADQRLSDIRARRLCLRLHEDQWRHARGARAMLVFDRRHRLAASLRRLRGRRDGGVDETRRPGRSAACSAAPRSRATPSPGCAALRRRRKCAVSRAHPRTCAYPICRRLDLGSVARRGPSLALDVAPVWAKTPGAISWTAKERASPRGPNRLRRTPEL